jgi:alginate O-acetyltransferase complex protein AlgI
MCVRWVARVRATLEANGFRLLPLQSPAVRERLRLPEEDLLKEMRVITREGRILGGPDAVVYLARFIFKPLFWLGHIPGAKPVLRATYEYIARNRTCNAGACRVRKEKRFKVGNLADWLPLLVLTPATVAIGRFLPAWLYMWAIAFALFTGCKWYCLRKETSKRANIPLARKLGFLFGWIGMDAAAFFNEKKKPEAPRATEWLFASFKTLFGAALLWLGARAALAINPLLAGWTGMLGIIFLLHFGFFHLLALIWRAAGVPATPLMRAPLLSQSLSEFWGKRWNTAFHELVTTLLFRPLRGIVGARRATLCVFLVSGLIHDLVISVPARGGYGLPTLYFLAQGAGVLFERTTLAKRLGVGRGLRGRLFVLAVTAGPAFWLFHPPFVRNVILPMLHAIGAT